MEVSPRRTSLYRRRLFAVIFAAVLAGFAGCAGLWIATASLHAQLVQQNARKQAEKGPRALGLVQITDKGKARIIPIAIMLDGKFYDAGSYKATPVPMALDFGIVYEAFRAGVSQGLFTITQPGELNHNWIAEGKWLPAGEKAPETTKKYAAPVIDDSGNTDDRPVLHRRSGGEADKDESKPAKDAAGAPYDHHVQCAASGFVQHSRTFDERIRAGSVRSCAARYQARHGKRLAEASHTHGRQNAGVGLRLK